MASGLDLVADIMAVNDNLSVSFMMVLVLGDIFFCIFIMGHPNTIKTITASMLVIYITLARARLMLLLDPARRICRLIIDPRDITDHIHLAAGQHPHAFDNGEYLAGLIPVAGITDITDPARKGQA